MEIQLSPGERVIWSGAPIHHRFFRRQERTAGMYYGLGALWGSLLLNLLCTRWVHVPVEVLAAVACSFLPVVCLLGLTEWLVHRTVNYQVTDRRVIVTWRMRWCVPINRSLRYPPLPNVKVRADGSGTVNFIPLVGATLHLEDIPDAVDTYRAIYAAWLHSRREE